MPLRPQMVLDPSRGKLMEEDSCPWKKTPHFAPPHPHLRQRPSTTATGFSRRLWPAEAAAGGPRPTKPSPLCLSGARQAMSKPCRNEPRSEPCHRGCMLATSSVTVRRATASCKQPCLAATAATSNGATTRKSSGACAALHHPRRPKWQPNNGFLYRSEPRRVRPSRLRPELPMRQPTRRWAGATATSTAPASTADANVGCVAAPGAPRSTSCGVTSSANTSG
mmetsp:Transcript_82894/g.192610  ORF Transcript_82894/g.192610 Transcript_82894/m.192610 type:complete len:223 (+) Transcript_82894:44-712(+)